MDLFAALRDPRERLLLKHGDVLILQETKHQALARYFTQQFSVFSLVRLFAHRDAIGTAQFVVP